MFDNKIKMDSLAEAVISVINGQSNTTPKRVFLGESFVGEEALEDFLDEYEDYLGESESLNEASSYDLYHPTYSAAVHHALALHAKKGLTVSDDDYFQHIATGPRKPPSGEGLQHILPAKDRNGDDHQIVLQVYNRSNTAKTPYELNTYSNKVPKKRKLNEAVSKMSDTEKVNKRAAVASAGIKGLFKVYGDSGVKNPDGSITKRPPTEMEHKRAVNKRFAELDAMSPSDREREYKDAKSRMTLAGARPNNILSNKTKTDTAAKVIGHGDSAKNGHVSLGMNGSPDEYHFHHDDTGHGKEVHDSCAGKTKGKEGCVISCLSKQGHGAQATIQGHRDAYEQKANHNVAAQKDFHTVMHSQLDKAGKLGKRKDKNVLIRPDVNTGNKHNRYAEAISKSFGPNSERVKKGTHNPAIVSDYSKSAGAHDPSEGIHATHSDIGPLVHHSTGQINDTVDSRRYKMHDETQKKGQGSYTVFNRPRPAELDVANNTHVNKEYNDTMNKLHTVRRYESTASEPNHHETASLPKGANPHEYHHKDGYGRIMHNGKSYRYQDHPVSDNHKLVDGSEVFAGDTDARHMDTSSRKFKTHPDEHGNQHKVGTVTPAFATAGTSHEAIKNSGLFHDVKDIDQHGIYHDSHPAKVQAALAKHPTKSQLSGAKRVIPIMNRLAPQKESVDMTFAEKLFEKLKTMKEKKDSILVPEEEQIDELKKTTVRSYIGKKMDTVYKPKSPTTDKEMNKNLNDLGRAHARLTGSKPTSEETELDEALGKGAEASEWISDFVHSKNPKFAGKSKEERKKQALAAYYGKKNESIETVSEDETTTDTLAGRVKGNTSKFVRSKIELDADGVPEDLEGDSENEHDDEKEDKELISKMVKKPCLTKESSVLKKIREVSSKAHKNVKETLGIASRSEVHEEDEQLDEDSKLDQWLNSIGVNPDHLTREKKIGYARSPAFQNWQRSH